ncbi:MAG: hypothetical protein JEY99_21375 [Spirochaetales bacterium]|nr:hypothetical protein [Spirochaetales bacterium]
MKKKILLTLLIMLLTITVVTAKDNSPFGSQYDESNLALRLAVGGGTFGFALYPGVEYIFTQVDFADGTFPVDFGAMAEGYLGYSGTSFGIGAAVYGTGHFGLSNIDIEYVENLDIFLGIGVGFLGEITFAGISGISYFIDPGMSVFLEYNYLANSSGCIGVQLHL